MQFPNCGHSHDSCSNGATKIPFLSRRREMQSRSLGELPRRITPRSIRIPISNGAKGEIGPELFEAACNMGLEGLVSKRADRPYRAGRSKDWIKIKNRKHPAYRRVLDRF